MNCAKRSYSAQAACALPWAWRLTWTDLCRWRHGWSDVRSAELFRVAQPVASCSEVGGISRRGEIAERRMRALLVVAPLQRLSLGGRTRARTWDPRIKRHPPRLDISSEFSQLGQNPNIRDQWLTAKNPTIWARQQCWRIDVSKASGRSPVFLSEGVTREATL